MTPQERLARLLADYPPSDVAPELNSFALVETSNYDNGHWVTTHESVAAAAGYRSGQECPEDWRFDRLVDLNTGQLYDEVIAVSYEPTVNTTTHYPEEAIA